MADRLIDDGEAQGAPAVPSRNLLQILWQRKALVLFGLTVGTLAGVLIYLQRAPVYQSSAQVHLVKRHADSAANGEGLGGAAGFYDDFIPAHLSVIRSPLIVRDAVKILRQPGKDGRVPELPSLAGLADPTDAIRASLGAVRDGSDVTVSSSNILILTYRGPVAEDCPVILDAIITSYQKYLDTAYRNVREEDEQLLKKTYETQEENLKKWKEEEARLRKSGPLVWGGKEGGGNVHLTRLTALNGRLADMQLRRAEVNGRLQAIVVARQRGAVPGRLLTPLATRPERAGPPERSLEQQLAPLVQQEQALLADLGEEHPKVKAVRRQIAMTRDLFMGRGPVFEASALPDPTDRRADPARVQSFVSALEDELAEFPVREKALEQLVAKEEAAARLVSNHESEYRDVTGSLELTKQAYYQALNRRVQAAILRGHGGFNATAIAPPTYGDKVAPNLSQILFAWVVAGLLAGVALAYLADITDKSFRAPEEIRRRLGLPIVGHIPYTARTESAAASGQAGAGPLHASLLTYHRPRSVEAEAYRSLRTALYFSTRGERHKVIQITSPNMGDGKSTLAANLAVCIAQSGKTVVLIDADCRRPRLHRLFGASTEAGLCSVISGECSPQEAVRPTAVPHLSVLPCGPRPANPAELLTSPKFEELLSELRGQYDFVLVDTPPLLAVTDPSVVASRADGVLLAIRVSKNGRPAAERAKEMLVSLRANILGVVVNGVGKEATSVGYSYRLYRYDHYGYEYKSGDEGRSADEAGPVVRVDKNGAAAGGHPADR